MIPENIYKRWSSVWSLGHVPTRPWWTGVEVVDALYPGNSMPTSTLLGMFDDAKVKLTTDNGWRTRCDGRRVLKADNGKWAIFGGWEVPQEGARLILPKMKVQSAVGKPEGMDTEDEAMALVDAAFPLVRPEIMAGQTWAWIDGDTLEERVIWGFTMRDGEPAAAREALPEHACLVAGPSCYGFNVPWAPLRKEAA